MRMKFIILGLIMLGIFMGISISFATYSGVQITSDEKFCVSCHEMDAMIISYKEDVHGGKGKTGANASCVSCHLPHNSLVNYLAVKTRNGINEATIHFFGNPEEIDWQEKLKHRDSYVYDSGCLKCHGNILDNSLSTLSKQGMKMHKHYQKLKGTKKEITCAFCHFDAGHKNMRTYLNYYKPEYGFYKEEMKKMKKEVQEKYKKYGIETSNK